jgi:hypothetical protein
VFRWLDFSFSCEAKAEKKKKLDDDDDDDGAGFCTTRHLKEQHLIAIHDGNNIYK